MMDNYSGPALRSLEVSRAERPAIMGKVLSLLGFAFLFTAGGVAIGVNLGPGAFLISLIGSFATLIALIFLKERTPINLGLLYGFATFEGMALGLILDTYLRNGLGLIVLDAAAATAAIGVAAGAYGATTKRDLTGLGGILMIGLIGVIIASVVGIFLQLPLLYVGIAAVSTLLFTGFLVYDLNR